MTNGFLHGSHSALDGRVVNIKALRPVVPMHRHLLFPIAGSLSAGPGNARNCRGEIVLLLPALWGLQGMRERLGNLEAVRLPQLEARVADASAGRPSQDLLESLHGYVDPCWLARTPGCRIAWTWLRALLGAQQPDNLEAAGERWGPFLSCDTFFCTKYSCALFSDLSLELSTCGSAPRFATSPAVRAAWAPVPLPIGESSSCPPVGP